MNFIFDIGNVLVAYRPVTFLHELLNNKETESKMMELIFNSPEWVELDKGTIVHHEATEIFINKAPEYKDTIVKVMDKIPEMLTPMNETIELLHKIKEQGHKLYFLSNYHTVLSKYIKDKYSFFDLFDGGVFSCDIQVVKPSPEIYNHLLNKYNLTPKDCIFFDDTQKNVIGANKLGITGVLFTGADDVERYI